MLTLVHYATEVHVRHKGFNQYPSPPSLRYARTGLDKLNAAWEALGDEEEKKQSTSFLVW